LATCGQPVPVAGVLLDDHRGVVALLGVVTLHVGQDQRLLPVPGGQRGAAGVPVRDHVRQCGLAFELRGEGAPRALDGGGVDAAAVLVGPDQQDQVALAAELVVDELLRAGRGRARILEAAAEELAERPEANGSHGDHGHHGECQYEPAPVEGQLGDAVEHGDRLRMSTPSCLRR
jgi:hypothetical protein